MRRRPGGHPAPDIAAIKNNGRSAAGGKLIGAGEARNARAHDNNIGLFRALKDGGLGDPGFHPKRLCDFIGDVHEGLRKLNPLARPGFLVLRQLVALWNCGSHWRLTATGFGPTPDKSMDAAELTQNVLMYFVLPLWLVAGFADYLCHRAAHIETTSGAKE